VRGDLEKVLFDEPAIHRRLDDTAAQISNGYRDRDLTVIVVADLLRRIPLPLKLDCLSVASYHGKVQSSGEVISKLATASPSGGGQVALPDVGGRDILVLDDVLDSGFTLAAVRKALETARPHSIRICVLLSKKKQRTRDVDVDYVGFEIEDEFVVGYRVDFRERFRNLPYIGVVRRELLEQPGK
jgi:hypoxanthine phosphoribosyltransferase